MKLHHVGTWDRIEERVRGFPLFPWGLALCLSACGILFIHSATYDVEGVMGQDRRQALAVLLLSLGAVPLAWVGRRRVLASAWPLYGLALLALLLLPVLGVTLNGARRWFRFGSMTLQPSEFVKPVLVLVLARWLRFRSRAGFLEGVVVPLLLTLLPMLFMIRQPDLGSSLCFVPVLFAMCYAGGARGKTLCWLALLGLLSLVLLYPFLHDYQKARILVWWSQDHMDVLQRLGPGYHLIQSLIAVGSGGWTGDGLFEGIQNRYDFLPYRSTDFLFSVLAEETGFLGSLALVCAYTALCLSILHLASGIRDRFGRLLAVGVGVLFATHLGIHVGVCTGLLPTTGLPLPLLSYGRSSLAGAWLCLALLAHALLKRERNLGSDRYR